MIACAVTAAAGHHGHSSPRGDGGDNLIVSPLTSSPSRGDAVGEESKLVVASTLTGGGHPNSNAPGRRREDDDNLVYSVARDALDRSGGSKSGTAAGRAGLGVTENEAACLKAKGPGAIAYHVNTATSCAKKDHAIERDHARALDTTGGFASGQGGTVIGTPVVAFDWRNASVARAGDYAGTVRASGEDAVQYSMAVRRLIPRECERLQGLPDNWTLIPGATDSKRYRAIGNGGAVPVVEWIARRLRNEVRP